MIFSFNVDNNFASYKLLLPLALILIFCKVFSLLCKKFNIPSVVGYLLSGILLGLITLIPNQWIFSSQVKTGIDDLAKIGVILIMFSAGMETDIKKIKATGVPSIIITSLGVIVPLGLGFLLAFLFFNGTDNHNIYSEIFYGVLLSATSVSITVSVLKEINRLDSKVGTCIVSAAILDDIIGIILLSLIVSLNSTSGGSSGLPFGLDTHNSALNVVLVILFMVAFFVLCLLIAKPVKKLFEWLNNRWPHHRRIPIFGFAFAFLLSFVAEYCFGVADITGAFMAGLILSSTKSKEYLDYKADAESSLFFGPIFFASIGLMLYDGTLDFSNYTFLIFGVLFIVFGLLGKILGAGVGGLISKFSFKDSLKIGVGMMARAEVIVVCAQKGIDLGLVSKEIMPFILLLIIISSFITPILLRLLYKKELADELALHR